MTDRPYTVHLADDASSHPAEATAAYADALDRLFGSPQATLDALAASARARQTPAAAMTPAEIAAVERWDQADIAVKEGLYPGADPVALKQVRFEVAPV